MATHRDASLTVEKMVFGMPQETGWRGCSSAEVLYGVFPSDSGDQDAGHGNEEGGLDLDNPAVSIAPPLPTGDTRDWTVEFTNIDGDTMMFAFDASEGVIIFYPGNIVVAEDVVDATIQMVNGKLVLSVSIEGTYRGKTRISTSGTMVAFRNQW